MEKIMVTEEVFVIVTILILFVKSKKAIFKVSNYPEPEPELGGAGTGAAIWICGSAEPKEIILAPQY
jgi:hypothetical protein